MIRQPWMRLAATFFALGALACHEIELDFDSSDGEIGLLDDLYSISVVDERHSVTVGYYGAAYFTEDGGETWRRGTTDTNLSIYSVSMADARHGWAVGQRGLILRTEDGGRTWTQQPNLKQKEGSHLFSVAAIDSNTAWAIGDWGTRIRTTDGGVTWVDHSFTIDEQHPQFVWLTPVDQERVRSGQKVYEDVGLNDIGCMSPPSRMCWLIGEFGYIFYSEDAGETWHRSRIEGSVEMPPVAMGYNTLELDADAVTALTGFAKEIAGEEHLNVAIEALANDQEIAVFGKADNPSELFEILEARAQEVRTVLEDAGIESDRLRMRGQPPWDYEDFLEDDPDFLDRYLKGRRSDKPGIRVRVLQNPFLFTIRFRDEQFGLIAGLGGVILRSTDGGRTWSYSKIDRKQALFSAAPVDGRVIAVGEKGLVRISTDQGNSWVEPAPGTFPEVFTFMRDVAFEPTGRVGYIVGQSGQILRTTDAGYQWTQVLPAPEQSSSG